MKVPTLQKLRVIREQDVKDKQNTYIAPNEKFKKGFLRDELMWVEEVDEACFTVFRCMDGKRYKFTEEDLVNLHLVGRKK